MDASTRQLPLEKYPVVRISSDGTRIRQLSGPKGILLDPNRRSPRVEEFSARLSEAVIGQPEAVQAMSRSLQLCLSGFNNPTRPIGILFFLGPTGSGKTLIAESAAEILFGDSKALVKVDCAEFGHSHQISKLIGSPPGYLGHRETSPMLTQDNLDKCHTDEFKFTFVLFDEIEKASDSLANLLLGIMDKGCLTLGDNRQIDFSKTIIIMSSNLGVKEIDHLLSGGIGFAPNKGSTDTQGKESEKISKAALAAVVRKFRPEFVNRIDKMIVFNSLSKADIARVLERELIKIQNRITESAGTKFVFHCSPEAKQFLLAEGWDNQYGGRHINRALERHLVMKLSNLVATEQINTGDVVLVDWDASERKPVFVKLREQIIIPGSYAATPEQADEDEVRVVQNDVAIVHPFLTDGYENFPGIGGGN